MKTIFNILDNKSPFYILFGSLFFNIFFIIFSLTLGSIYYFEPMYTIPIIFASWYGSKKTGLIISFITICLLDYIYYFMPDFDYQFFNIAIFTSTHLISYILLSILVTNFRKVQKFETLAADTDNLTGLLSSRAFYSNFAKELKRSSRYNIIFSLAYIDIDDFKLINDTEGHPIGDKLLINVSNILSSNIRETDSIGRLGGDEFACLFPETNQEQVKIIFKKILTPLNKSMSDNNWKVTFSIGVITFESIPSNIKIAIKTADDLMYRVKKENKNNIAYEIY